MATSDAQPFIPADRLRRPLNSNVRQPRERQAFRHLRCAAMGREVTASSTARCPVASAALGRLVLALGPAAARSDEHALVVRYLATAPPGRLRPSLSKPLRARQPRHRAAQGANSPNVKVTSRAAAQGTVRSKVPRIQPGVLWSAPPGLLSFAGCLTLRSSRPAPASHLGREAVLFIIHFAAKAPRLHGRLTSNVGPHRNPCLASAGLEQPNAKPGPFLHRQWDLSVDLPYPQDALLVFP